MIEVAGAAGNIAMNLDAIDPNSNLGKALNFYNVSMAIIGVKNIGKGVINFAKNLPEQTKNLLKNNGNIRTLLQEKYQQFKASIASAKNETEFASLDETAKQKVLDQEKLFDELMGVNGAGSVLVNSLSQSLKAVHFKLVNGGMQIVEQGNIIKYLAKNGDEIARIENGVFSVSKVKGSIPNPSTYLDAAYITNHVNKFKQEGAGFIVVKNWTEDSKYLVLPPRKFVGLQSEMDAVIAKYKAHGNDWTVLRDELNLGANTSLADEEIYYVKIDGNDSRFSFDMPNGNEGGAIVGEWVPGGSTKTGTTEAALVGSENIIHNKSITQLLNNFSGKWEKIK